MAKATDYPSSLLFKCAKALRALEKMGVDVLWFLQEIISNPTFRAQVAKLATPPNYFTVSDPFIGGSGLVAILLRDVVFGTESDVKSVPIEVVDSYAQAQGLRDLMSGMGPRDMSVVVALYGLDGTVRSGPEVARCHNISVTRVQQIRRRAFDRMLVNVERRAYLASLQKGADALDLPIEELNLSERPRNCLKREGQINTIGDLVLKTRRELLSITNLTQRWLDEIIAKLDERELILAVDPS